MNDLQLIEAVKSNDYTRVKEFIDSGADINQQDEYGWTPLNWASGRGDLKIVTLLLEKGADVLKVGRDQRTPYRIALAAGHVEVVKLLRKAEDDLGEGKVERQPRVYCKAYHLGELRQFSRWTDDRLLSFQEANANDSAENQSNEISDDEIVFIHGDFTVTKSMWHNENVVFDQVTPEWEAFCADVLKFKVPDDLDIIVRVDVENS
jgi:uncharacterized protein